jgi:hypothetical protein
MVNVHLLNSLKSMTIVHWPQCHDVTLVKNQLLLLQHKIHIILRLATIDNLGKDDALTINIFVVSSVTLTILQGSLAPFYTRCACVQ